MLPIVGVPKTIQRGLVPYRTLFGRAEGFEHVSRYIAGLILIHASVNFASFLSRGL